MLSFLVITMRFFIIRLLSKLLTILVSGCYNNYLLYSHNFESKNKVSERLANSLVKRVREEVIGFLGNYLVES